MPNAQTEELPNRGTPEWLQLVRGKVESLHFGIVQIIVHDNHVTQIEQTEKTRLDSPNLELVLRRRGNS